jgi:hypothetical protein
MIAIRKPTIVVSCALAAYSATAPASSVAGIDVHARARLDDIGDDQADDQRQGREEQEIGERLGATRPTLPGRACRRCR